MPLREYVWLDGRPLAQLEYTPSQAAPRPYYFHLDHIGMPRALSSPEGATVWSAATNPSSAGSRRASGRRCPMGKSARR
ncbi:RHS domain-containing protein [Anaeromyxobacter dehalogenans]|uniref:RHS domain-containing protein n=1 Tax=Anaeromyxobacter dehalogenans TaxID=161493 RepID=UPI003B21D9EF